MNVWRGHYDRNPAHEQWVNSRPFDRSGNIFFKNQPSVVRALVMQRWADRDFGSRSDWSRHLNHIIQDIKAEMTAMR
eukprot:9115286-Alexandrium_andersonii.AAC.1